MIDKYAKKYSADQIKPMGKLYLGISIVVAIAVGYGIGYLFLKFTGSKILFFIGISLGISAAIMNIVKEFVMLTKSLKELEKDETISIIDNSNDKKN